MTRSVDKDRISSTVPLQGLLIRSSVRLGFIGGRIEKQLAEEVGGGGRIGQSGRGFWGGGRVRDLVAHRVDLREQLAVNQPLPGGCGLSEPEVVDLHERDQIGQRCGLDLAQLVESLGGVRPFEQPNEAGERLDETRCIVALPCFLRGGAWRAGASGRPSMNSCPAFSVSGLISPSSSSLVALSTSVSNVFFSSENRASSSAAGHLVTALIWLSTMVTASDALSKGDVGDDAGLDGSRGDPQGRAGNLGIGKLIDRGVQSVAHLDVTRGGIVADSRDDRVVLCPIIGGVFALPRNVAAGGFQIGLDIR